MDSSWTVPSDPGPTPTTDGAPAAYEELHDDLRTGGRAGGGWSRAGPRPGDPGYLCYDSEVAAFGLDRHHVPDIVVGGTSASDIVAALRVVAARRSRCRRWSTRTADPLVQYFLTTINQALSTAELKP